MSMQLAYALITPSRLYRSQTGPLLARLLADSGLELAAARMFTPSAELTEAFAELISEGGHAESETAAQLLAESVRREFAPDKDGRPRPVMALLLKGEQAVAKLAEAVGPVLPRSGPARTIRESFAQIETDATGAPTRCEPAVIAAMEEGAAEKAVRLWARRSDSDGGLADNAVAWPAGANVQRTLVLIKPENFREPSARPGCVLDRFARTGLFPVGIKVLRMSLAQAMEFYGPVREILCEKLKPVAAGQAKELLEKAWRFPLPKEAEAALEQTLGPLFGENQFDNILRFMSGRSRAECPPSEREQPGSAPCLAIILEGPDAVTKVREALGPTNPRKAPPGTVRRDFGADIMVNAAHASDSPENAAREMGIVRVEANQFLETVEAVYGPIR